MIFLLQAAAPTVPASGGTALAIICAAIPLVIASITTMIVTIRNGNKVQASAIDAKQAVMGVKADLAASSQTHREGIESLRQQTVEIHGLVNGDMDKALSKIEEQRLELTRLTSLVQKLETLILGKDIPPEPTVGT